MLASLLLIASGLAAGCRTHTRVIDSPFAADDEYPQLFWMFTLIEVPAAPCPADLNNDRAVNAADLSTVLASWGACGKSCPADIDGNGMVDAADLSAVLAAWGSCG